MALQGKEDELRFLRLEAAELRRAIESLRARQMEKRTLEQGLIMLQVGAVYASIYKRALLRLLPNFLISS